MTDVVADVRPFQIKLDGEVIAEIPDYRTVERVRVMTSGGEAAAPAISFDQDSIDIFVELRTHLDAGVQADNARLNAEPVDEVLQHNEVAVRLEEQRAAHEGDENEESASEDSDEDSEDTDEESVDDEQSTGDSTSDSGLDRGSDSPSNRPTGGVDPDFGVEKNPDFGSPSTETPEFGSGDPEFGVREEPETREGSSRPTGSKSGLTRGAEKGESEVEEDETKK